MEKLYNANFIKIGQDCVQKRVDNKYVKSPIVDFGINAAGISDLRGIYDISRSNFFCHVAFFTLEGEGEVRTSSSKTTLKPGSIMIVPAHTAASYGIKSDFWKIIWFDISNIETWDFLQLGKVTIKQQSKDSEFLFHAMRALYRELYLSEVSKKLLNLLSEEIILYLKRELKEKKDIYKYGKKDELISLFRKVESRLQYPWSVYELSKLIGFSSSHLHLLCKKHLDCKPMQHVTILRMEKAKDLLLTTQAPISDISYSLGYENPLNFSTAFKKYNTLSPKKFRMKHLKEY